MTKILYARIPDELHTAITSVADTAGTPMTAVVVKLLYRALGMEQISIDEAIAVRQNTSAKLS